MSKIIDNARRIIAEQQMLIAAIQENCSHPKEALTFKYGSNTGNWDPHDDCYWTDYECGLCEKRWSEEGSNSSPKCHREGK